MVERDPRHALGQRAEALVAGHLRDAGFAIVARNARVGRLEIDLIARRNGLLVFCEVRARRSRAWVHPLETITPRKVVRIREAARRWLGGFPHPGPIRLDAAAVCFDGGEPAIEYIEGAF